ncbi:helicase, putative [Bodo saltans]|uniref:Helicase, putative n=1 Tax=Bodo saltans TaxID=75058 RepID=A0A0S4JN31_BODSA|nr:helicase, putative [Bodo saltans]|eukprot:CUG91548.1 helicase, putative [Bodo saltans]
MNKSNKNTHTDKQTKNNNTKSEELESKGLPQRLQTNTLTTIYTFKDSQTIFFCFPFAPSFSVRNNVAVVSPNVRETTYIRTRLTFIFCSFSSRARSFFAHTT